MEETGALFGVETSARRRCLTDGGACGRRGARYQVTFTPGPLGEIVLPGGGSLSFFGWQLEDDDTAAWSGAPTCETPPRASISLEATAFGPPPPEPAACTSGSALALGGTTAPLGAPAIVHAPAGPLEASATVTAIETSPLTFVLDVDGVEHTIEVPLAVDTPAIDVGDVVFVELTGTDEPAATFRGAETLTIRETEDGAPLAYYRRGRGYEGLGSADALEATFGIDASLEIACRIEAGGQCGRGVILRAITVDGDAIHEGESHVVATTDGEVRVRVHALADDNDIWANGPVCAIGALVAEAVDAVRAP